MNATTAGTAGHSLGPAAMVLPSITKALKPQIPALDFSLRGTVDIAHLHSGLILHRFLSGNLLLLALLLVLCPVLPDPVRLPDQMHLLLQRSNMAGHQRKLLDMLI